MDPRRRPGMRHRTKLSEHSADKHLTLGKAHTQPHNKTKEKQPALHRSTRPQHSIPPPA